MNKQTQANNLAALLALMVLLASHALQAEAVEHARVVTPGVSTTSLY